MSGPVRPGQQTRTALRPLPVAAIDAGFWATRQRINATICVPQALDHLESVGNLHNLRLAAGHETGRFQGDYPFMDSDVYKWLEAASWLLGEGHRAELDVIGLRAAVERVVGLVAQAQQADGYLNTWQQTGRGGGRYTDLRWSHELYCAGHLIQAAVAHHRVTGSDRLLAIARRFADHIDATFGPPEIGKPIDGVDGHPEVETALVELYRETGEPRYLKLASYFLENYGKGLLGSEVYCQDRVAVRDAEFVAGHAVRQLYLLAGATDVACETDDDALRATTEGLWSEMTATKTYLTGGVGAHHEKEEFGDPYELPTEHAYCETCAAVASIQWSWRLALLTGRACYSDLIERTLYNGFLSGVSLDGDTWLYVNPLQVRDGHVDQGGHGSVRRTGWFRCACCPPNVMRLLASLAHYLVSTNGGGIQVHQYACGTFRGNPAGAPAAVTVNTDYPWDGRITITVDETPAAQPWTLSLRIPQWCSRFTVRILGNPRSAADADAGSDAVRSQARPADGWLRLTRRWEQGERVLLDLDLRPRLTRADPRVDAARGCVAIERGPLVYCVEQADHPDGVDDIVLDPAAALTVEHRPDLLGGVTIVRASGNRRTSANRNDRWWPYADAATVRSDVGEAIELTAIPYYAWANRQNGGMRVWLPTS